MEIAKAGLPLHVHAELHNTIDAFLDQIEAINKEHPIKNLRWTLAHMNQIDASQLERMKKLGMYAAVHPWAVINGGDHARRFRGRRVRHAAAAHDSEQRHRVGTRNRRHRRQSEPAVHDAVFCRDGQDGRAAPKSIRQTISREDALIAHTRKNAYLRFPGEQPRLDPAGQAGGPGGAGSRLPHRIAPFAPFFRVIDVREYSWIQITNRGMPFLS